MHCNFLIPCYFFISLRNPLLRPRCSHFLFPSYRIPFYRHRHLIGPQGYHRVPSRDPGPAVQMAIGTELPVGPGNLPLSQTKQDAVTGLTVVKMEEVVLDPHCVVLDVPLLQHLRPLSLPNWKTL
jgi:hypothetical protein